MADKLPPLDRLDPAQEWRPWAPDAKDPWGPRWAGHLYRRATFGPNPAEVKAAVERGPEATVEMLLAGEPQAKGLEGFLHREGEKIARRDNINELRAWWLYVMLNSGHPLREKMTLFWHNHFVSSFDKVRSTKLMLQQNKLLRQHALGAFGPFLLDVSKDGAMLMYLDSNSNVKGKPNENYARELMELFSLGVGNYTEKDVKEAARAFTGWHTDGDGFDFSPALHDDGDKTVLGTSGKLDGGDVCAILLKQPACARFLARKLYRNLISEAQEPPDALLEPLAEQLRKTDYDLAALLKTMLSSRHFFSGHAYRQRIKSPVELVLGAARATADTRPESKAVIPQKALVGRLEAMGQTLFAPPNVKGWPGARSWLNTSTVLARSNFAQALAVGELWKGQLPADYEVDLDLIEPPKATGDKPKAPPEEPPPPTTVDPARLIRQAKATTPEEVVRVLIDAYLPGGVGPEATAKLVRFVQQGDPKGPALDRRAREAVHAILSMPEYQLA
jgi:hypothetical protein